MITASLCTKTPLDVPLVRADSNLVGCARAPLPTVRPRDPFAWLRAAPLRSLPCLP